MSKPPVIRPFERTEMRDLAVAKSLLENPGLTARLASLVGSPLERGFNLLPKGWTEVVHKAARTALLRALNVAVATMGRKHPRHSRELFHKVLVGASGGIGGAFGLVALPVELPISTTIMLRSIADIARSEGLNIGLIQTKLECLEVFALGSRSNADNAAESAYWATRAALGKTVSEAAAYLAEKGVIRESAPAIVRLINEIGSRFGVIVSEELAAKAVPLVGAATGGLINVLFIDHFQDMARGHFIIKRLEAAYGIERVRAMYDDTRTSKLPAPPALPG